jgi:hypothetical protein
MLVGEGRRCGCFAEEDGVNDGNPDRRAKDDGRFEAGSARRGRWRPWVAGCRVAHRLRTGRMALRSYAEGLHRSSGS